MKTVFAFAASLLLCATLLSVLPLEGEGAIYGEVIRLHVLAESDGEADQENKLAVRDAILEAYGEALSAADLASAAETVAAHIPAIKELAEQTLVTRGCTAPVTVTFEDEYYPARVYETLTFPAGTYRSLRVVIGEGEGKNWWCVLFPPMCVGAASGDVALTAPTQRPDAIGEGAWRLVSRTGEYELRFRFLELLAGAK